MTSSNIIPFPLRAAIPPRREHSACEAPQPAAASYSPIGNPPFDPVFFNEALFERALEAVRGEMK